MTITMNPLETAWPTDDEARATRAAARRVLVAEDNEPFADLKQRVLVRAGYAVDICGNGADALAAGLDNGYDAILLDVMIPGLDGFSVLRHLREDHVTIPILMMSARDTVDGRVNGLERGADDYLVKPFDLTELVARLRAHLRRTARGSRVADRPHSL